MASGFTRLSKGLSALLLLGYLVTLALPWTIPYLALVPAKTIPFVWNIVTAGYIEQSVFGLIVSITGLLYGGKLLDPLWATREFLKFVVFVNAFTLFGVYITSLTLYYLSTSAEYLYVPLSGFHGVLSGFLVGAKQVIPNQDVIAVGSLRLKAEWLPSLVVLTSVVLSFITPKAMQYLPFVIFGTYGGWLYIRYFQRDAQVNLIGYPVDEFAFSTFFPVFLRPVIELFTTCFHNLLCKRDAHKRDNSHITSSSSSHDPDNVAEAYRWREKGARALDSKLQGMDNGVKLEDMGNEAEPGKDHAASLV